MLRARALEQALRKLIDAAVQTACKIAEDGDRRWHVVDLVCATNDAEKLLAVDPPPSGASSVDAPIYRQVYIVTHYPEGGLRGVHASQAGAEAEIAELCREYPDYTRQDFSIVCDRIRPNPPSGASPQAEELRAANVANLREMVGMAGRHRETLLAVRECILALSPGHRTGYDWNADPLFLTLKEGRALNLIDDALKATPASPQTETGRCTEMCGLLRCRLNEGHSGLHQVYNAATGDFQQFIGQPAPVSPVEPTTCPKCRSNTRAYRPAVADVIDGRMAGMTSCRDEWHSRMPMVPPVEPEPTATCHCLDCEPLTDPGPKPSEDDINRLEKAAWDSKTDLVLVWYRDRAEMFRQRLRETERAWQLDRKKPTVEPEPCVWRKSPENGLFYNPHTNRPWSDTQLLRSFTHCPNCPAPLKVER